MKHFKILYPPIILIVLWESFRFFSTYILDLPSFQTPFFVDILWTGILVHFPEELFVPVLKTGWKLLISFSSIIILSLLIGLTVGRARRAYVIMRPVSDFLRSIPPSSLFPVFMIIFGLGDVTKIAVAIYFCGLILSLSVADAVAHASRETEFIWEALQVPKKAKFIYLVIPQVATHLLTGLRVVASILVALILITEMYLGSTSGLGERILFYYDNSMFPQMYGAIVVAGLIGFAINYVLDAAATTLGASRVSSTKG